MIIVRIWEGLGNQLFQYAYARALQLRTGKEVYLDNHRCFKEILEKGRINRKYTLDKFNIKLTEYDNIEKKYYFVEQRNITQKLMFYLSQKGLIHLKFYQEENNRYKSRLEILRGNWYLMGWFQSEKYFSEYRQILLKELTPKKKIHISSELKSVLTNEITVSVHIRRTDFKKTNNELPLSYYIRAINLIQSKVITPYYLVFTDDIDWVKDNLDFGEKAIFVGEKEMLQDYEELFLMSKCRHNIIANSTFSWWGAWLNQNPEKIVIGPKVWFNAKEGGTSQDIMPKEWIRV